MIAAIYNGAPVEVESSLGQFAELHSLGRDEINHYVGRGSGILNRFATVPVETIETVAELDPKNCEALQSWIDAMADTDRLADDRNPATAAAVTIEERARENFLRFLHATSLTRRSPAREISPKLPQFAPVPPAEIHLVEERIDSNIHTQRMAVCS